MLDALVGGTELLSAQEHELAFADQARIVKSLAVDLGQDTGPIIDMLARRGFDAALDMMATGAAHSPRTPVVARTTDPLPSRSFH
ncbi:hypothetical protein [Novosphingobium colocasiae]|nr:hypothetical protein [Novosphingobium colocasiae]